VRSGSVDAFAYDLAHNALHVLGSRIFGFNEELFEESAPEDPPPDPATVAPAMAGHPRIVKLAIFG
jgi:hypothetical protein